MTPRMSVLRHLARAFGRGRGSGAQRCFNSTTIRAATAPSEPAAVPHVTNAWRNYGIAGALMLCAGQPAWGVGCVMLAASPLASPRCSPAATVHCVRSRVADTCGFAATQHVSTPVNSQQLSTFQARSCPGAVGGWQGCRIRAPFQQDTALHLARRSQVHLLLARQLCGS